MIVLDASAALEMVQRTEAGNTFEELVYNGETIISVDLFYGEVLSAFTKYACAGLMSDEEVKEKVEAATRWSIALCLCETSMWRR